MNLSVVCIETAMSFLNTVLKYSFISKYLWVLEKIISM